MTKNDLLVLGLLMDRPMYGYEIAQHARTEGITTWFEGNPGTIYYALGKLSKRGLIAATRTRGEGPERSVYQLTEGGRAQFFASLESSLAAKKPDYYDYDLGVFLLNRLPRSRALPLLRKRIRALRQRLEELEQALQGESARRQPLQRLILEHRADFCRQERDWLVRLVAMLRSSEDAARADRPDLLHLSGDLRTFHLPDLIKLIASGGHSGTLAVSDGVATRTLTFQNGRPTCASSEQAAGMRRPADQVLNDIYDLFRWQEGVFTFDQSVGSQEGYLSLQMSAEDLILAGTRWVDNWATIQHAVPAMDTVFELRRDSPRRAGLDLTAEDRRVLEALNGVHDVAALARACELTEFETSKILYTLAAVGLVQPGDRDKIRLRRAFREIAELTCHGTYAHRTSPDDSSCEGEVNRRCASLPVRLNHGRIEDHTDPGLPAEELGRIYWTFLHTQREVIAEWFGLQVAKQIAAHVSTQISPALSDVLQRFDLFRN